MDREWLVRASYNNIWGLNDLLSLLCLWNIDSNECSAGSASLDSGTRGHGLDQDPVIEGFGLLCGVYETHTPQTTDSNHWVLVQWLNSVCQWCLRATVHTYLCPGRLNTPGEMHTSGLGYKSILTYKGSCKLLPVPIAVKIRKKKWSKLPLEAETRGWLS